MPGEGRRPLSSGWMLCRELLSMESSVNLHPFTFVLHRIRSWPPPPELFFHTLLRVKSWTGHPGSDPGLNTVCVSAEGY